MSSLPATIGSYRIVRKLGEGGMGAVFEAVHQAIERRVAIKTLKPEYTNNSELVARFFNEARAVNRVEHPSLVQVSDYGQTPDGIVYLVMEYLRGVTLRTRMDQVRAAKQLLSPAQLLQIAWQVAEALVVTHEKGIVHRDLKPENIMLVPDPAVADGERAKILDFGIAKLQAQSQVMTAPSCLMGTPRYMSPEQCRGAADIDGRTDVYALGIMLYEMLAGQPPFGGDSLEGIIAQHLFKIPDPLSSRVPQAPAKLAELVHRMLIKEPAERPKMAEMEATLRHMLTRLSPAQPDSRRASQLGELAESQPNIRRNSTLGHSAGQYPSTSPQKRRTGALLWGAVVIAGLVALGFVRLHPQSPAAPQSPPAGKQAVNSPTLSPPPAAASPAFDKSVSPPERAPSPGTPVMALPAATKSSAAPLARPDAKMKEKKLLRKPDSTPLRTPPAAEKPPVQNAPHRRNMYDGIL